MSEPEHYCPACGALLVDTVLGFACPVCSTSPSAWQPKLTRLDDRVVDRKRPRAISCGCCTGGCICPNHQDVPRGFQVTVCAYHQDPAHPHPRETEVQ